jgi:AGCS family alanine or glycine:cation symporter
MFQANQAFEGFYSAFVEQESLAEQTRKSMSADELRPLLTDAQLKAVIKADKLDKDTALEDARAGLTDERVRSLVRPKQVEPLLPAGQVQANQAERASRRKLVSYGFGALMASMVAVVVIGGITRIGAATSKIVPAMCLLYVGGCLFVIAFNVHKVPSHIGLIFTEAFKWESAFGGLLGVIIIGFKRAAFSSEAGLGSSAIAHSAAKTDHPVREGFVASLEPFIDTIIICFMTAMVVLITDAYIAPELIDESNGSAVTLHAFKQTRLAGFFPYVLSVSIVLFAFSTMISWCYYGERAWGYLVTPGTVVIFRIIFVLAVFVGAVTTLDAVLEFSDLMILSMAFPNILGGILLAPLVKKKVKEYWSIYRFAHVDAPKADADGPGAGI